MDKVIAIVIIIVSIIVIYLLLKSMSRGKDTTKVSTSKQEIPINKKYIKIAVWGFICAFLLLVVIEHFGKIVSNKWYPQNDDKYKQYVNYQPAFYSPFKPFKEYPPKHEALFKFSIDIGEYEYYKSLSNYYDKSDFKGYFNCLKVYIKATFYDLGYLLLFWLIISGIMLFFKKFKIKIQ